MCNIVQYKPPTNFNLVGSSRMSEVPLKSTSPTWAELILKISTPNMIDKNIQHTLNQILMICA